jgi:hypothetical protein
MESKIKMKPGWTVCKEKYNCPKDKVTVCIVFNFEGHNEIGHLFNYKDGDFNSDDKIGIWKLKKLKQDAKPNTEILPKKQHNFR